MDVTMKILAASIIAGYVLIHLSLWRAQERQIDQELNRR